jgi:hypothetical protein
MQISPVSGQSQGISATGASAVAGGRFEGQWQSAMNGASSLLDMSRPQLDVALTEATNLSAVAAGRGISDSQLVDTLKQGLQGAGSALTGSRLDRIAARIARHHTAHHSWNAQAAPAASQSNPATTPGAAFSL